MNFIYPEPNTRINEQWLVPHKEIKFLFDQFDKDSKFKNFVDTFDVKVLSAMIFQRAFLHIVTETVYHYPSTFISEKTLKPIVNRRPFVIVGPVGSLKNLRAIGFKTFGDYWNEEYDLVEDPGQRMLSILKTIKDICSNSIGDLQNLCNQMSDVLEYNFDYYANHLKRDQLNHLEQACIENLKPRYDTN